MRLKLKQFDQETVEMIPDTIDMQSSAELSQYSIKAWSLTYTEISTFYSIIFDPRKVCALSGMYVGELPIKHCGQ